MQHTFHLREGASSFDTPTLETAPLRLAGDAAPTTPMAKLPTFPAPASTKPVRIDVANLTASRLRETIYRRLGWLP